MNLYDLDTPVLIIDLDRLERNIAAMAALVRAGGKALRPHTKTHKTPEVARLQVSAGARGLTVAKLGEAEVLADAGFDDLLIANELVGAAKVSRLLALRRRVRVAVGVDSLSSAAPIGEAASREGLCLPVRMEIDTGLHRAGVRAVEDAVALGLELASMPGIELEGLFTHEGHAYRPGEAERAAVCAAAAARMRAVADGLRARGVEVPVVSVGSTPGAAAMAAEPGIDEMRPGVYVFNDQKQAQLGASLNDCALSVLTTVISRPEPDVAIVDAGTKALSGDRGLEGSKHGIVLDDPGVVFDWASEEHGHLDLGGAILRPRVGQKLRVVPFHACACVNMHDTLCAARGEQVEAEWRVAARGRMR